MDGENERRGEKGPQTLKNRSEKKLSSTQYTCPDASNVYRCRVLLRLKWVQSE